jgi:hypothetical protein
MARRSFRSDLLGGSVIARLVDVRRVAEWTCPACGVTNEEVGDVHRVRVVCAKCGRGTYIRGDGAS